MLTCMLQLMRPFSTYSTNCDQLFQINHSLIQLKQPSLLRNEKLREVYRIVYVVLILSLHPRSANVALEKQHASENFSLLKFEIEIFPMLKNP